MGNTSAPLQVYVCNHQHTLGQWPEPCFLALRIRSPDLAEMQILTQEGGVRRESLHFYPAPKGTVAAGPGPHCE